MDLTKQEYKFITVEIQNSPADCSELRKKLLKPYKASTYPSQQKYYTSNNKQNQKDDSNNFELSGNGFFDAFYAAYILHGEVEVSADDIWMQVCHYTAKVVNENSEQVRYYFVDHEEKKTLTIFVDGLSKDFENFPNQNNNWPLTMELLSNEINKNTKKGLADTMRCDFSTTTEIERASSNIIIMATTKSFFNYRIVLCGCGIQKVHFKGQKEDYQKLLEKLKTMKQNYPMNEQYVEYLERIEKIVLKFIETIEGKVDLNFWNTIFDTSPGIGFKGSGMQVEVTKFNGWFKYFFGSEDIEMYKIPSSIQGAKVEVIDEVNEKTYQLYYQTELKGIEQIREYVFKTVTVLNVLDKLIPIYSNPSSKSV